MVEGSPVGFYKCCKQTIRNSYCTGAAGIEAAEASADLMMANIAHKESAEDTHAPVEEKRFATWGTEVPADLVRDQQKLVKLLKRRMTRGEERDERKRKYNVKYIDEVTPEEMEAYRMKKVLRDDPTKDFLH